MTEKIKKPVIVGRDELSQQIAIGMHTGLRKGADTESAHPLWLAIQNLPDDTWDRAAYFCADGLEMMGYTVIRNADHPLFQEDDDA